MAHTAFVTYKIIYYPIRNKTDDIYLNALADDVLSVMGKKLEGWKHIYKQKHTL